MQIRYFLQVCRFFGPRWLSRRLGYAVRLRLGMVQRQMPMTEWEALPIGNFVSDRSLTEPSTYLDYRKNRAPRFFFKPEDHSLYRDLFLNWDVKGSNPITVSDELEKGALRYFDHTTMQMGFPPKWFLNPFIGKEIPANEHWSKIEDFLFGDIKAVWEPSRFGFVFALVRSYWRTGEERYAEIFWKMVEDWRTQNPPQQGPNWKCGQEISFRLIAWCFGLYGFLNSKSVTAKRVTELAQMIAISGNRIESNLEYALNQQNNHGISEGTGLWTIGLLFPEFCSAKKWQNIGRQVLETLGRQLIYQDGSFVQHSVYYQRLMLHDFLWSLRLGDIHGQPLSDELKERVAKASVFLYEIQDEESGRVPCYGQNDGSLILPLNNCDYQDFRPVIQASYYLFKRARCYENGPWDEDLFWLFGESYLDTPIVNVPRKNLNAEGGGYYTLRSEKGFVFVRCGTYQNRPAQADMLHVDLWWRGQNVAIDPGTFSYNYKDPWNNSLAHTAYHNTVTVDGYDQMDCVEKFLWLPWLKSKVTHIKSSERGHLDYWEGEHNGYNRLKFPIQHRRSILRMGPEHWLICDALNSTGEHTYRLHWLLQDSPYKFDDKNGLVTLLNPNFNYNVQVGVFNGHAEYSLVRGDDMSPRGWSSPYYLYREPALSLDATAKGACLIFWTVFGASPVHLKANEEILNLKSESWSSQVRFSMIKTINNSALISSVLVTGNIKDLLEIS